MLEPESSKEWDSKLHQNVLTNFGPVLAGHMVEAGFEPNEDLLMTWYKTLRCFSFHKLMHQTKSGQGYVRTWEAIWLHIGRSLKLYQQTIRPIRCAYNRCPAPDIVLFWECKGCHVKYYCSQRCQHGYVEQPLSPSLLTEEIVVIGYIPQLLTDQNVQEKKE